MSEKKNQLLKISLVLSAIILLGYGVQYLFLPGVQIKMMGGEPIPYGWINWFGAVMIPLGIGCILVIRNPVKQGIFVTTIFLGSIVTALALFHQVIFVWDDSYNMLNTLIPAIVLAVMAILLWLSLRRSKDILW
jgi:hypothetical protein